MRLEFEGFRVRGGATVAGPLDGMRRGGVDTEAWSWEAEIFLVKAEAEGFLVREGTEALFAREVAVWDVWSLMTISALRGPLGIPALEGVSGGVTTQFGDLETPIYSFFFAME